jgi:hypothetical protein
MGRGRGLLWGRRELPAPGLAAPGLRAALSLGWVLVSALVSGQLVSALVSALVSGQLWAGQLVPGQLPMRRSRQEYPGEQDPRLRSNRPWAPSPCSTHPFALTDRLRLPPQRRPVLEEPLRLRTLRVRQP